MNQLLAPYILNLSVSTARSFTLFSCLMVLSTLPCFIWLPCLIQ